MVLRIKLTFIFLVGFLYVMAQQDSIKLSFNGQVTTWAVAQFENPLGTQFGGRFVPTLLGDYNMSSRSQIDFEASLNINGSANFSNLKYDTANGELKPYRVWARYSGRNWEVRAGLQKINFGQAKLFRPLMWFDAMDVRDPLQLTDGVYAVLGKYFFENNANIWVWGLLGNENPKGFEMFETAKWKPELGGRVQLPMGSGQMAVSSNFRKVIVPNLASSIPNNDFLLNESKIGLDGKWDVGIGLWFESSVTITDKDNFLIPTVSKVQDLWNVGADYTLPFGNGIGVTLEYFRYHAAENFLTNGLALNVAGTMLTYPLSMFDNLSGMAFFLPDQNKWMNYLSWSRTYDNLSIYGIAYWNPGDVQLVAASSESKNLFSGTGIQIMLNYNF